MALRILAVFLLWLPNFSNAENSMCKGLKKINNLDELLYQFYINLDSDCLFTMPVSELEKIWGIKILSEERVRPGQKIYQLRTSPEFDEKPYFIETDAFYVEKGKAPNSKNIVDYFRIVATDAYFDMHATLFPDGKFPKLLPPPHELPTRRRLAPPECRNCPPIRYPKIKNNVYQDYLGYYWMSSKESKNKIIIIMAPSFTRGISRIDVVINPQTPILKKLTEQ